MIAVELQDAEVQAGFASLDAVLADLTPVMQEIGAFLVASVQARIDAGVTHEGVPFAPRSQTTLDKYAKDNATFGGVLRKAGYLRGSIASQAGPFSVEVGSNRIYAAVMQFGAEQGAFGSTSRGGPIPWGDIPARPYLGLSETDRTGLLDIIDEQLAAAAAP